MNNKKNIVFSAVGGTSLMVIFAVLCLTVFALLAISTVQADCALSDSNTAAIMGYYSADCAAEETLARLRAGEMPAVVKEKNGVYYYTHPISDTQILAVEVKVDGTDYEIFRWQAVSTMDWQASDRLPVRNEKTEEESKWQH